LPADGMRAAVENHWDFGRSLGSSARVILNYMPRDFFRQTKTTHMGPNSLAETQWVPTPHNIASAP